jgi:hypothetical protein
MSPMTPSAVIQASDAQASQRAYRAYRSQRTPWPPLTSVQPSQHAHVSDVVSRDVVVNGCEDITKPAHRAPVEAVSLVMLLAMT